MPHVPLTLQIDARVMARLDEEAKRLNRPAADIAQDAIRAYVEMNLRDQETIRLAELEADQGVFISGAAVDEWVHSWSGERELPAPEPDIFPKRR